MTWLWYYEESWGSTIKSINYTGNSPISYKHMQCPSFLWRVIHSQKFMVEKVGDRKNLWCKSKTLRGAKKELGYSFKNTVRKLSQIFIRLNEVLQCNDFKVILRRLSFYEIDLIIALVWLVWVSMRFKSFAAMLSRNLKKLSVEYNYKLTWVRNIKNVLMLIVAHY